MDQDSISFGREADDEDRADLRHVYDVAYPRLVAQLYRVTGDLAEAEELVQGAFVRASTAERRFRRADDPEAWLRTAALRARRREPPVRHPGPIAREQALPGIVPPDFDELVCDGARRRVRRRTRLAATAYVLAAVVGAVALVDEDDPSAREPSATLVPLRAGLPEVEEVGDRIPPGRAALPSVVPGEPVGVSVEVPPGSPWRENASGSGIYSAIRDGTAWLHLATYVVDGVVHGPCRSSYVSAVFGTAPTAVTDALSGLPRADVVVRPHPVTRWGTTAVHLRVRVPHAACRNGNPRWTFDTLRGGELLGNEHARLDFWVVELRGRAVVVEAELPMGPTTVERRALARLLDSLELDDRESR
ncbi:RNA polymerase sigma factor [Nocardioides sediminis]|uniref:RNA polymerase sigma factor n=1 Tax=Nocardioides sediminis TaxID=433648 RepID=UPI00131F0735|nr:sigma factor [Nocardioides sediminis]